MLGGVGTGVGIMVGTGVLGPESVVEDLDANNNPLNLLCLVLIVVLTEVWEGVGEGGGGEGVSAVTSISFSIVRSTVSVEAAAAILYELACKGLQPMCVGGGGGDVVSLNSSSQQPVKVNI